MHVAMNFYGRIPLPKTGVVQNTSITGTGIELDEVRQVSYPFSSFHTKFLANFSVSGCLRPVEMNLFVVS